MKSVKVISLQIFILTISALLLFSCSQSNKITDSWTNPDATKESIKFNKIAVFGLVLKTSTRRIVEDELCRNIVNTISVPSYKVVSDDDISNPDLIKTKLTEQGFDGALVLRLVDVEKRESYSPGVYPSYYYSFGGFYNYSYGFMYSTGGTYRTDQIVTAEINIYSIKSDKLIWSGQTMTMNPNNIEQTIAELSESVKKELEREGLLERELD